MKCSKREFAKMLIDYNRDAKYKKMTNGDWLRQRNNKWSNLTDEEIESLIDCDFCPLRHGCLVSTNSDWNYGERCNKKLMRWLKQEAK